MTMNDAALKYLVIENAPDVCKGIEERMQLFSQWRALPYSVSPKDAIGKITSEKPELIFIDWSLNGGSAYEVLDHIQEMQDYEPYIIFNTAYQKDNPEIPQTLFNNYKVDKYIIKPIWEPLRKHLAQFLTEAKAKVELLQNNKNYWFDNHQGHKIMVALDNIICICQHPDNKRVRNIYMHGGNDVKIQVAHPWADIYKILEEKNIDFFITKSRAHLVCKKYVIRYEKPFVRLKNFNFFKIDVTRDNVKNFEEWLLEG